VINTRKGEEESVTGSMCRLLEDLPAVMSEIYQWIDGDGSSGYDALTWKDTEYGRVPARTTDSTAGHATSSTSQSPLSIFVSFSIIGAARSTWTALVDHFGILKAFDISRTSEPWEWPRDCIKLY
jgi:hypothetical protein